jgi:hypothetical protein
MIYVKNRFWFQKVSYFIPYTVAMIRSHDPTVRDDSIRPRRQGNLKRRLKLQLWKYKLQKKF